MGACHLQYFLINDMGVENKVIRIKLLPSSMWSITQQAFFSKRYVQHATCMQGNYICILEIELSFVNTEDICVVVSWK